MAEQSKTCPICRTAFVRPTDYSHVQWRNRRFCSKQCSEEQKRLVRRGKRRCRNCGSSGPFHSYTTSSGRIGHYSLCKVCRNAARRPKRKTEEQRRKGRQYSKRFRDRVREAEPHRITHSKAWAVLHPERYLFHRMRANSYKHKERMSRELTFDQFLREIGGRVPDICPVLGIALDFSAPPKSDCVPTVDRLDSRRPYEIGNIAIISWRANIIKNMGTADEHRRIAEWMSRGRVPPLRAAA